MITRHEPIHDGYLPRKQLDNQSTTEFLRHASNELLDHLEYIKKTIANYNYLETGHPCWSSLRYLSDIFKGQMKMVFLTRNPVAMAKSWMTLGAYSESILPHQKMRTLISPFDPGVQFEIYKTRWDELSQFEKLIYYWLEVNYHGCKLMSQSDVPVLHLKFEDLFCKSKLKELTNFLEIPFKKGLIDELDHKVDQFNFQIGYTVNQELLNGHPEVQKLMKQLNY